MAANVRAANITAPIRGIDRVSDPRAHATKPTPVPDSYREKFVFTSCCSPWPNTTRVLPNDNMTGSDSTIWREDQAWEPLTWSGRERLVKAGGARGSFSGLADITFPADDIPRFVKRWKTQDAPWEIVPPGFCWNAHTKSWQFHQAVFEDCMAERKRRADQDARATRRQQTKAAHELRRTEEAQVRDANAVDRVQRQRAENLAALQAAERREVFSQGHTYHGNGAFFRNGSQVSNGTVVNNNRVNRMLQPPHDQQLLQMTHTQETPETQRMPPTQQMTQAHQMVQYPEAPAKQQMTQGHSMSAMAPLHPGATNSASWNNGTQLHAIEMNGTPVFSTVFTPQQASVVEHHFAVGTSDHSRSWSNGGNLVAPNVDGVNGFQAPAETRGTATNTAHAASTRSSSNSIDLTNDFTPPNNIKTQAIQEQRPTWMRGHGFDSTTADASDHSVEQNNNAVEPPASDTEASQAGQQQAATYYNDDVYLENLLAPVAEYNRQSNIEAARRRAEEWPRHF